MTFGTDSNRSERRSFSQLDEGIYLARSGNSEAARAVFRRIIHNAPENETAWLWLAWVAESREESLRYLREAQALLPASPRLADAVRWAEKELGLSPSEEPVLRGGKGRGVGRQGRRGSRPRSVETPMERLPEGAHSGSVRQPVATATRAARDAGQELASRGEQLAQRVAQTGQGSVNVLTRPVQGLGVSVVALVAFVAMMGFVVVGLLSALNVGRGNTVQALVLPTPVPVIMRASDHAAAMEVLWAEVDGAFAQKDWEEALASLEKVREMDPESDLARRRLAEAHHELGLSLVIGNDLERARIHLNEAIRLDAGNEQVQATHRQLQLYLDGLQAYYVQDWETVVRNLKQVYREAPDFRDTREMLAEGFFGLGVMLQEQGAWDESKAALDSALQLRPGFADAETHLAQVMDAIFPPRRVEVNLTELTATVFENHEPVKVFPVCTGRPGSPTLPGRYEIQNKLPMAYASQWDLNMPYWLGIYDLGPVQNGFHALPILTNGATLWEGALGTKCSFGCIVLGTEDAKFLYDWSEIGTVVYIVE